MIGPSSFIAFAIAVLEDPELREAVRAFREATAPAAQPKRTTDLTTSELAMELGCSTATIVRSKIPPTRYIGKSPRFDLDDARAKFEARGALSTTPTPKRSEEHVDIGSTLRRSGLRAV